MATLKADALFAEMDKTPVSSGILYDRVVPFAGLHTFDGQGLNASSPAHWLQAWHELQGAAYSPMGMESAAALREAAKNAEAIPVGLIAYDFQQANPDALADGSLYFSNEKLLASATPLTTPFLTRTAYVMSPLAYKTIRAGQEHIFAFSPDFVKTNAGRAVSYLDLQTEQGGPWRRLYPGQPFSLAYAAPGMKKWTARVFFVSGETASASALLEVAAAALSPVGACEHLFSPEENALLDAPYHAADYDGADFPGKGELGVYYGKNPDGSCKSKITRPVIFLDGFDSGDERGVDDIYKNHINYTKEDDSRLHMGDQLRAAGRDLLVLNFPDGAGLIERNAMVLVKLLQLLQSSPYKEQMEEEAVVIGPSMGGLIARYALAYCEKNGIDHKTRLYVSFDSPHAGAHIPLAVQQLPGLFVAMGRYDAQSEAANAYNAPAAKQMLMQHHEVPEGRGAHPYRATFLRHLGEVGGYPKKLRKVSVINGSSTGLRQAGIEAGGQYFNVSKSLDSIYVNNGSLLILWTYATVSAQAFAAPASDTVAGRTASVKIMFALPFIKPVEYTADGVGWAGHSPDAMPGGFHDSASDIARLTAAGLGTPAPGNVPAHCFIPSFSAVDLRLGDGFGPATAFGGTDLPALGLTPFDKIYAPTGNERHVQLSPTGAEWFKTEILDYASLSVPSLGKSKLWVFTMTNGAPADFTAYSPNGEAYVWNIGADAFVNGQFVPAGQDIEVEGGAMQLNIPCSPGSACYGPVNYFGSVYARRTRRHGRSGPRAFALEVWGDSPPPGHGPETETARAAVRPNPAKGEIRLVFPDGPDFEETYEAVLFNGQGKAEVSAKGKKRELRIPVAGLRPGIYYLHVITKQSVEKIRVEVEN